MKLGLVVEGQLQAETPETQKHSRNTLRFRPVAFIKEPYICSLVAKEVLYDKVGR